MDAADVRVSLPGFFFVESLTAAAPPDHSHPFFYGPENLVAVAVVARFLEGWPRGTLCLYGSPGTGKTHLLDFLEGRWRMREPEPVVLRWRGGEFGQVVAAALVSGRAREFRRRAVAADVVMVDDLQHLTEYPGGQRELAEILRVAEKGKPAVVVASRLRPWRIGELDARIGRILEGGLTAPLHPPGPAVRKWLLLHLFRRRGLGLTDAAATLLAQQRSGTAREIVGLSQEAERLFGPATTLDFALAEELLRKTSRPTGVKIDQIARATARYFGMPLRRLRGAGREREVVLARGVAMYLSQRLGKKTLKDIGRYFGGRDHTTVSHHCRKIEGSLGSDFGLQEAMLVIEEMLESRRGAGDD